MSDFLPYARQSLDEADIDAVTEVLRSDWLTTGPAVEAFEAALADAVDARFAVACSSGTAALHLSVLALGLGPGDAVVVPAISFVATANCARFVGAEVVFADVDPETGLMGSEQAEAALARAPADLRVRAVLPVHLAGQCGDPIGLKRLADERDLFVVEDACHALGATYGNGARVGAGRHCDLAAFSFHAVKTVAMGEGGAVTGRDPTLARRLRALRSHGLLREPTDFEQTTLAFAANGSVNPWYYEMADPGFNYRASDIHCALGASQLSRLERLVTRRRELVARYDVRLAALAPHVRPLGRTPGCTPAWHLYVVLIDFAELGTDRASVMTWLREAAIGTQVHYIPIPWQPYYRARYGDLDLPGAAAYYAHCLSLPLFPGMADEDVERVVDALADAVGL